MPQSDSPVRPTDGAEVFERSRTPMALLDGGGRITRANPAWAGIAGRSAAELIGLSPSDSLPLGADPQEPFEAEGGRWLRLHLETFDDGGFAQLVDVTAEWLEIAALKDVHEIRGRLLQDAMVGAWRYDPDTELYHFETTLDMGYGMKPATPVSELVLIQHRDDRPIEAAHRERLTREEGTAEGETRYRHADGSWVHLHYRIRTGRRLASGRYELHGLSQNITQQARARDEARAGAQRLKLALKGARAAAFEYDFKSGRFWTSTELAELIEPRRLQASGTDPLQMFHEDDREAVAALRRGAVRGEHPEPVDVRVITVGGDRWMRLYLEVEQGADGRARRAVGLLLDIEEEKRQGLALAEARRLAEEATAAKSAFLASVSHEIRTPMNGIIGVLNLLRSEPLSAEAGQLLSEALGCSEMLGQLINDVLDFSKIEAGKLEIEPTPAEPAKIAQSVAGLIRPQAEAKGLTLTTEIAPDIGWRAVDPVRLRQCLFNTLGNAVKFTAAGGVTLRMRLVEAGAKLRCEVEDTGVGIAQADQARLFDRFSQAEGAGRRFGGTGLGLAITRTLARLMGGEMGFTSVEGQGSTFWFEIAAPSAQAAAVDEAADETAEPLAGLRVLIVDDNRVNRLVAGKTIEALGADAVDVESGEAAIAAVARGGFDLVLMDVNMPGMDGLEATRRIRALPGPPLPVIAMTADVMAHHKARYAAAGMDGLVPKPFSPAQLLSEIVRLLAAPQAEPAAKASA